MDGPNQVGLRKAVSECEPGNNIANTWYRELMFPLTELITSEYSHDSVIIVVRTCAKQVAEGKCRIK